jgi:hypothetical protein
VATVQAADLVMTRVRAGAMLFGGRAQQSDSLGNESDTLSAKVTIPTSQGDRSAAKATDLDVFALDPVNLSTSRQLRMQSLQRRLALLPCPAETNTHI